MLAFPHGAEATSCVQHQLRPFSGFLAGARQQVLYTQASVLVWVTLRYAGVKLFSSTCAWPFTCTYPCISYGSPLEWPLERSLVSSVIGMLGIRLKDRVTGSVAFVSRWMWNLCTGSICCLFLQPEVNGHKRLRKNPHLTWLRNVFCCICWGMYFKKKIRTISVYYVFWNNIRNVMWEEQSADSFCL